MFAEKVMKKLEVIKLAFSNFLYNNLQNSTNALIVFLNVCYHQLCSPETGKKVYQFYKDFCSFWPQKSITNRS